MSFQRKVIRLLDRPGGRAFLAWLATTFFRRVTGNREIKIVYDRTWAHRAGRFYFLMVRHFSTTHLAFGRGVPQRNSRYWSAPRTFGSGITPPDDVT